MLDKAFELAYLWDGFQSDGCAKRKLIQYSSMAVDEDDLLDWNVSAYSQSDERCQDQKRIVVVGASKAQAEDCCDEDGQVESPSSSHNVDHDSPMVKAVRC